MIAPVAVQTPALIIETNDGRFFRVRDAGVNTPQAWIGVPVKRVKGGFAPKANATERLVRKACSRVVAERGA